MLQTLARTLGGTVAVVVLLTLPALAEGDRPELKRVVMSTGGVAYLEYEAVVDGDATLQFSVPLDQVDDVLKSFIVLDDKGGVGSVSLAGRQPLDDVFRDLPFGPDALASPAALLRALVGEEVKVDGPVKATGRILGVTDETRSAGDGTGTTRHRLTLATDSGLQQVIVERATSIRFVDDKLRQAIATALAAISEHRVSDQRTLTLTTTGEGKRRIRLGYVVAAPLWKTSYRLALGDDGHALLQGWATLENMSGQDWRDVELTLVSGNPVTFRQAIYQAYWIDRPEVPVDVAGHVMPGVDSGGVMTITSADQSGALQRTDEAAGKMLGQFEVYGLDATAAAAAPSQVAAGGPTASEDAATQVVFRIATPVTLAAGRSLSVPIVSRQVPATQVALYQPQVDPRHPLAAVRLVNDGATGLPPGVVTIYQVSAASGGETFVGDARLGTLPAGDHRLVAYALDQRTLIDREDGQDQTIGNAKIDRGVLYLSLVARQTTTYTVKAPVDQAIDALIEHPRQPGWDLAAPTGDVETTNSAWRLPLHVAAGQTAKLEVVLRQTRQQSATLADMNGDLVASYARNAELSRPMRDAFARIAELKGALDAADRKIAEAERQRQVILDEQARLRDNLARVPAGSDLANRYLQKLSDQEDAIEALLAGTDKLHAERETRRQALQDYISGLEM